MLQLTLNLLVERGQPGGRIRRERIDFAHSKIDGTQDDADVLRTGESSEDKEVFSHRVAHGDAADGDVVTVNHDIAAEVGAAFFGGASAVEGIGIVNAQSEMKFAVRIQLFHRVKTLGDLLVAAPELRAEFTARGLKRIRANITKAAVSTGRINLQGALLLKPDKRHGTWREWDMGCCELRNETCADGITKFGNAILGGFGCSGGRHGNKKGGKVEKAHCGIARQALQKLNTQLSTLDSQHPMKWAFECVTWISKYSIALISLSSLDPCSANNVENIGRSIGC